MNQAEFQQRISNAGKPVIIDFWASWCGPCMMTKPILDKLGKEYAEKVEFMPVNADESREVLEQFKVFGIPTVITLRDGKEAGRVTGAQNEAAYRAMFEALAEGREVKVPMTAFDRILRLGAGAALVVIGINTGNWLVAGIGGIIAFMGIYDRCPIWQAVTGVFKR
ncbi:MAG: thioredoxin [Chloroflexi bacterium]|nr:thioredoxin [Chloroflexota bacterium]